MLALAPALALAAGSVATLRLLPRPPGSPTGWPGGAGGSPPRWPRGSWPGCRCARRARRCCSRWPSPPGRSRSREHASWLRSASDQAAFATGGDVQVDPFEPLDPSAGAPSPARGADPRDGGGGRRPGKPSRGHRDQRGPGGPRRPAARRRVGAAARQPVQSDHAGQRPAGSGGAAPRPVRDPPRSRSTAALGPAGQTGPVSLALVSSTRPARCTRVSGRDAGRGRPRSGGRVPRRRAGRVPLRVAAITVASSHRTADNPGSLLILTLSGLPFGGWAEQVSSGARSTSRQAAARRLR